jgi:hypothetical protein
MSQNLKKDTYLTIKAKIDADFKEDVKTFRLFNNQFDNEKKENAFAYPAVFVQYEVIDYIPTTNGSQQGDLVLTFHVGFQSLKTEDLAILDLLDKLFIMMTDLRCGFTRIREEQDIDHDAVQVWKQSYKITMTDDTANIHNRRKTTLTVTDVDVTKEVIIDPQTVSDIRTDKEII